MHWEISQFDLTTAFCAMVFVRDGEGKLRQCGDTGCYLLYLRRKTS
jgi:predicted RNA-binding Zn ribbon-like protein